MVFIRIKTCLYLYSLTNFWPFGRISILPAMEECHLKFSLLKLCPVLPAPSVISEKREHSLRESSHPKISRNMGRIADRQCLFFSFEFGEGMTSLDSYFLDFYYFKDNVVSYLYLNSMEIFPSRLPLCL